MNEDRLPKWRTNCQRRFKWLLSLNRFVRKKINNLMLTPKLILDDRLAEYGQISNRILATKIIP